MIEVIAPARKRRSYRAPCLALFLALLAVPYLWHVSQDLPRPVIWDEAQIHVNAKDIVLFGTSSLKDGVLYYIFFPLNIALGVLSFSLLGNSLASLRLPYILLNIAGNILFFDFVRRSRGPCIAAATTTAFALYAPRFIIGKSAMSEALVLPLLLALIWLLARVGRNPRAYCAVGVMGVLIFWTKLDNIFVPLFVTGLAAAEIAAHRRNGDLHRAWRIAVYYFAGAAVTATIWLGFYLAVGWRDALYYFSVEIAHNLNIAAWSSEALRPLTLGLLVNNIGVLYEVYPGFLLATVALSVFFVLLVLRSRTERASPLSLAILLLLFLLAGKLCISVALWPRRIAPCYPLPFLLMVYVAGAFQGSGKKTQDRGSSRDPGLVKKISLCLFLLASVVICYLPDSPGKTLLLITSPTYERAGEARRAGSLMDERYKAIYFDGRFSYLDLQLPFKFIQPPPDLNAKTE